MTRLIYPRGFTALLFWASFTAQIQAQSLVAGKYFSANKNHIPDDLFRPTSKIGGCDFDDTDAFLREDSTKTPEDQRLFTGINTSFLVGLCHFYKGRANGNEEANLAAVGALQKAQIAGLLPAQQNLAAFFEGLTHARIAQSKQSATNIGMLTDFCGARAMASAAFGSVNWSSVSLSYQSPPSISVIDLNSLVGEMSAHYREAGIFDENSDARCAINAPIADKKEYEAAIEKELAPIVEKYFGPLGPVGGMFSRKIENTEATMEGAEKDVEQIRVDSERIDSTYRLYNREFAPVKSKIADLVGIYQGAVVNAYRILDEYTQWSDGLWLEETKSNGNVVRIDHKIDFNSKASAFKDETLWLDASSTPTANDKPLQRIKDSIERINAVLKPNTAADTKTLCAVYYCQIKAKTFWVKLSEACKRPNFSLACTSEGEKAIAAVCQNAGIEDLSGKLLGKDEMDRCAQRYLSQN